MTSCDAAPSANRRTTSTTTSASTTTSTTTKSPLTTTTTISTAAAACSMSALSAAASQGSGAGGHEAVVVVFTNISSRSCTLYGYPTSAWFLGPGSSPLPATVVQQVTPVHVVTVTLSPGQPAATTLWTDNQQVPSPSCGPVTTSAVAVQLSAGTSPITTPVAISVCCSDFMGTTPISSGSAETLF